MHFFLNLLNVGTKSTHISDGNSLEPATKKKRTSYESVSLPEGRYSVVLSYIQLFRERLSEEMRTRQSRKVIWDMINTLFVTTEAVEPRFVAFL